MSTIKDVAGDSFAEEVLNAEKPVVVDFWAPWCGPCRIVGPEIEKMASQMGDAVKFVKVNVDDNQDLAIKYGIMSIPTVAKFERGTMVAQVIGARGADAIASELALGG